MLLSTTMLQHGCCCVPAQIDSANVLTGTQTFSSPAAAATATKSLQLCPTLCDPMDCSLPGSSIHRIFQARVLEWGAIASSSTSFLKWEINSPRGKSVDLGLPLTEVQILSLSHTRQMALGLLPTSPGGSVTSLAKRK